MTAFIQRRQLSRRALLRGAGAALALPFLDAMMPALASAATRRRAGVPRAMFVFLPNGQSLPDFFPQKVGSGIDLPYILEPFAPIKKRLTVFSGLTLDTARAHGDGPGDHARGAASFLTAAHPKKTGGADIHAGVSVDQVIAAQIGEATRLPSLEIGCEGGRLAGDCDSGYACAYVNNISWRTPSAPMTKETEPRNVFERLFGNPDDARSPEVRARRDRERKSILDFVRDDASSLRRALGSPDQEKLDEYLSAVRDLELAIGKAEASSAAAPKGFEIPKEYDYPTHLQLLYDLAAMAFRADLTRVITMMVANGGSNRSYPFIAVPDGHHAVSHHGNDQKKLEGVRKINRFHAEHFVTFLRKLAATPDGDRTLLDRAMVVYGCAIADGDRHDHHDLPILLAGGGNGTIEGDRHLRFPKDTPLANLHLAVMDRMNVRAPSFGDSTTHLDI